MTPFVSDPDFTLYIGDALEVLRELPAGSIDCCVTSPPYWGLRDYGTGTWTGGDSACDHLAPPGGGTKASGLANYENGLNQDTIDAKVEQRRQQHRDVCRKCGATRTDSQLGLEPTPDAYVAALVAVFREVRRVLADHGTVWLNLGDSYAASVSAGDKVSGNPEFNANRPSRVATKTAARALPRGLKPKDLVGIPWRVAFALQADGWYLRSDIVWSKPNPMPESVTDRPTKAHEYVFLLAKRPRYYFDQEALREAETGKPQRRLSSGVSDVRATIEKPTGGRLSGALDQTRRVYGNGRNVRSVWEIATQPYPDAHFATFPEELPRRCIAAGCPEQVCATCGKPRERQTDVTYENPGNRRTNGPRSVEARDDKLRATVNSRGSRLEKRTETTGWSDCGHDAYRPGVVLDPFMGSGTTALVARKLGRHAVGIELNPAYAELAARRLQQLSLLAEGTA